MRLCLSRDFCGRGTQPRDLLLFSLLLSAAGRSYTTPRLNSSSE